MKKIQNIGITLLLALSVSIISCSKDDDGGSGGNAASGTITAKVNGTRLTSTEMLTVGTKVNNGTGTFALTLQGTNMDGKGFQITLNAVDGEGTYEIGGSALVYNVVSYIEGNATSPMDTQTWTAPYDDNSARGEVKISTLTDSKAVGTFEFTCKNPNDSSIKNITEGSFNVDITTY
ncbi:MAG: hypothetical protein IE891_01010 [Flavobacteriaceae bacterium]|nr:hypothetical protein [Flavobacteriaceae bacterium]